MPRKKTPGRIKSHPELLERISFEIGRAILDHLESPTTAKTRTTAIDRGIDYLKLNGFDTEALTKAQRQREALKRMEGGSNAATEKPIPPSYDAPPLDEKTWAQVRNIPAFDNR